MSESNGVMPTVGELCSDLQHDSSLLFKQAFQDQMQGNLPPAFQGKPLWALRLKVFERPPEHAFSPFLGEAATFRTVSHADTAFQYNHVTGDLEQDNRSRIATSLSEIVLGDRTDISDLTPQSVVTEYAAYYTSKYKDENKLFDEIEEVNTDWLANDGVAVALGHTFINSASSYLKSDAAKAANQNPHSDIFLLDGITRPRRGGTYPYDAHQDNIIDFRRTTEQNPTSHRWGILISPHYQLNGHESKEFLEVYMGHMQNKVGDFERWLSDAQAIGRATPEQLDLIMEQVELYRNAFYNALRLHAA